MTDHLRSKRERFAIFIDRLRAAPAAASDIEAMAMLRAILNEVEDEFSGVPDNPAIHTSDGRLYPPQDDAKRSVPGRPDLTRYRNRGHNTYVGANGAISIVPAVGQDTVLAKPGQDGNLIVI